MPLLNEPTARTIIGMYKKQQDDDSKDLVEILHSVTTSSSSSPKRFMTPDADEYHHHEYKTESCAEVRIVSGLKLALDNVADKRRAGGAELGKCKNVDTAGTNTIVKPEIIPGTDSGRITRLKNINAVAAEILRGLDKAAVDLHYDGVQRHYHVRQIVIDHAKHNGAVIADKRQRLKAERGYEIIDDAGILRKCDPREGAQKEAYAHRQHNEHVQKALSRLLAVCDKIRNGVADDDAYKRGDKRKPYAFFMSIGI